MPQVAEESKSGPEGPLVVPEILSILPLSGQVLFPGVILPIEIRQPESIKLIEETITNEVPIFAIVASINSQNESLDPKNLYRVGCAARILKAVKLESGSFSVIVQGLMRIRIMNYLKGKSRIFLTGRIKTLPDSSLDALHVERFTNLAQTLKDITKQYISRNPELPHQETMSIIERMQGSGQLSDFVTANVDVSTEEKQDILEALDIHTRTCKAIRLMTRQLELLSTSEHIHIETSEEIKSQKKEISNKNHEKVTTEREIFADYAAGKRDFQGIDLSGQSLKNNDLSGADFRRANLAGTQFHNMNLTGVNFSGVEIGPECNWPPLRAGVTIILALLASAGAALTGALLGLLLSVPTQSLIGRLSGPLAVLISGICMTVFLLRGYRAIMEILMLALFVIIYVIVHVFTSRIVFSAIDHVVSVFNVIGWIGASGIAVSISILAMMCVSVLFTSSVFLIGRKIAPIISMIGLSIIFMYIYHITRNLSIISVVIAIAVMLAARYVSIRALMHDRRFALAREIGLQIGCLEGTSFISSDLTGANFSNVLLGSTDFTATCLVQTCFLGARHLNSAQFGQQSLSVKKVQDLAANYGKDDGIYDRLNLSGLFLFNRDLSGRSFCGTNLEHAMLRKAKLQCCKFQGANLREADLRSADLTGASLDSADLRGACLADAKITNATWQGAQIDIITYSRSSWDSGVVAELHKAGVEFIALDMFPEEVRATVLGIQDGMSIYFLKQLAPLDRFVLDGTIFGVLGKDTDCHVIEFRECGDITSVRLGARNREDLERVAEALYLRVWANLQHKGTHETALQRNMNLLGSGARETLTELQKRIERIELQIQNQQTWRWDFNQDRVTSDRAVRLFLSYAAEDQAHCQQLEAHLSILKRQGVIETWHSGLLQAGSNIVNEQQFHFDNADIVLILLSADYLRCDDLYSQLEQALHRQAIGKIKLLPVLARTVELAGCPLEHLQCLPNARPISKWEDKDEAWTCVTSSIRRAALSLAGEQI